MLPPLPQLSTVLMLVVMTFNVGLIMATVSGFALGAFLFGHVGEPRQRDERGSALGGALKGSSKDFMEGSNVAEIDVSAPERDVEAPYVMEGGCCCGGAGVGTHCSSH